MTAPHNFSNNASSATLAGSLSNSAVSVALDSFSGFPAAPFTATVDRNTATEEIVLVTDVAGSTVTLIRGYDGTTAQAHSAGASFEHTAVAKHFRDAAAHVATTGAAHGTTSAVVGVADVQTLSNKTVLALLAQATAGGPALTADAPTGVTSKLLSLKQAGVEKTFVDYQGNLSAQNVTGAAGTFSGALSAAASTLASLAVTGNATVGGTLGVTGATTLAAATTGALTSTTVHATGAVDFDSTANVDGNLTVGGSATITGDAKAALVELTGQASQPAAPAAGKYKLWTDTLDRVFLRTPGGGNRLPVSFLVSDWTPLAAHSDGDFGTHVTSGERRIFTGTGTGGQWKQFETRSVANAAERNAFASPERYTRYQVKERDTGRVVEWDGTRWVKVGGPPELIYENNAFTGGPVGNSGARILYNGAAVPAHTAGTLRFFVSGLWTSGSNAAGYHTLEFGAGVNVPGATNVRWHNSSNFNGAAGYATDGYIVSDGTAKTLNGFLSVDTGGGTITVNTGNLRVWLV